MSKLTGQEIIEKFKEIVDVEEFAYYTKNDEVTDKAGIGEFDQVAQYGGEGQGDTWWSVKYFKDHDVYLKVVGYYASHNGTDFEGWESVSIVTPKEKTVTVYEKLND